jgi:hypothetical protein
MLPQPWIVSNTGCPLMRVFLKTQGEIVNIKTKIIINTCLKKWIFFGSEFSSEIVKEYCLISRNNMKPMKINSRLTDITRKSVDMPRQRPVNDA